MLTPLKQSFIWLRRPAHLLVIAGLILLAVVVGGFASAQRFSVRLSIGGADVPFVSNANGRNLSAAGTSRSLRDDSFITLPAIHTDYPLTLSLYLTGSIRQDVQAGKSVSFTLSINGRVYPPQRLYADYRWYSWRIDPAQTQGDRLDIEIQTSKPFSGILIWPVTMLASELRLDPAASDDPAPAWGNTIWLVLATLAVYSFGAGAAHRKAVLSGLLLSVVLMAALGWLLANNPPLFGAYLPSLVVGMGFIRLAVPLLSRGDVHPLRWLFILTLAFGLLLALPDFQSSDDAIKYLVSASIILRGTPQLPPPQTHVHSVWAHYALGHSIASLPLLARGLVAQQLSDAPDALRYLFALLLDPIVTAGGVVLLFLCGRRLFGSAAVAMALSLVYFFATFALPYAVQSWSEPLLATLLLAAFYAMLRVFDAAEARPLTWLLLTGFALGYLIFTKEEFMIAAAIFVLWWAMRRGYALSQAGVGWPRVGVRLGREGLRLAAPLAVFLLANLSYNLLRNGSIFRGGYYGIYINFNTPLALGLYGLLVSPGKGLLWYAPPLLLSLVAARRFWRGHGWEAVLIGVLFGVALPFYATYLYWDGGVSWGPRFLLPYLPLLMLVGGAALVGWADWRKWQRHGYAGLVLVGAIVAGLGLLTNPLESWWWGNPNYDLPTWAAISQFDPAHSPIVNSGQLVTRGYIQPQAIFQLTSYRFPPTFTPLVAGILIALIGLAAGQLVRSFNRHTPKPVFIQYLCSAESVHHQPLQHEPLLGYNIARFSPFCTLLQP